MLHKSTIGLLHLLFLVLSGMFLHAEEKIDELRQKASQGDAPSCFYLGNEYFYGEKRKKNPVLAAYWYRKAAEKGIPEAQYNYACCLEGGIGIDKDPYSAFGWYEKASGQHFHPASFRLAKFYQTGIVNEKGVVLLPKSPASSMLLLEELNAAHYEPAQLELCTIFLQKKSSPENKARAFSILQEITSKKRFSPAALRMLADCYYGGFGCKADPAKLPELLQKAADLGDAEAMGKLGFLYEYGRCVREDKKKAGELYRQAAYAGHPMSQLKFAEAILEGKYADVPRKDALKWYASSADKGCPQAMFKLGVLYYEGILTAQNKQKASYCFFQAAKAGYARGQYNLACMFSKGEIGGKKDPEAAFYWFLMAAEKNDVLAQKRVADCFRRGEGIEKSYTKTVYWLERAAENGDQAAAYELRLMKTTSPY